MYTLVADANVFLDALLTRGEMAPYAFDCLQKAYQKEISLYISSSNLLNVIYFLKKDKIDKQEIANTVNEILRHVGIAVSDEKVFSLALQSNFADLEDAVQYYTALSIKEVDYFITSNLKDYKNASSRLPVISPRQFMTIFTRRSS